MQKSYKDILKKGSQWILVKKWRRNFRDSVIGAVEKEVIKARNEALVNYNELITPTNDRELKKRLLKENLRLIEVEIASFCNRKCWFCPNSYIDRHSSSMEFPESQWLKVLDNLAEIDYDKTLNFHRFNETLANKDLILKRVQQARNALPKANLGVFTNGDYLDREYLDKLRDVGVSYILMSYYFAKNQEFDVENIIKPAIDKMARKLGLKYKEIQNDNKQYMVRFIYEGLYITYRAWNPRTSISNRGGSISDERVTKNKRDFPCFFPMRDIYIDYNGLFMPCCNMRSDVESHKEFILGDICDGDLFDIFMSEKFIQIRKDLMTTRHKKQCEYCHY